MAALDDLYTGPTSSAAGGSVVVPSDTIALPRITRGVYVGGTGNVTVVMADDSMLQFVAVPAGVVLPVRVKRINATGTSAVNMIALY